MRPISIASVLVFALVVLGTACGNDSDREFTDISQRPRVWPRPTDPPPASPIYHDVKEDPTTEEEIERESRERPATIAAGLEGALLNGGAVERETAFVFLLPELLQVDSQRLLELHARLPEPARKMLGIEIARQWMSSDAPAATRWIKDLPADERRAAVVAVAGDLASWAPQTAQGLADAAGLGREAEIRKLLSSTGR